MEKRGSAIEVSIPANNDEGLRREDGEESEPEEDLEGELGGM